MLKSEKPQKAGELEKMISGYPVIAVLNMHKLPARQLQSIRESLRGKAIIRISKKSVLDMAVKNSKRQDIGGLISRIQGEPALLFSNENPFRLFSLIKNSRSPAAAKANDIAPKDIVVQKGPTGLPPGPAISTLQKAGLKTTVQGGKIAILQDKTVAKAGEKISEDVVGVLNLLKAEPMEIGLELVAACEGGFIYGKDVLDVDVNHYISLIQRSVFQAVSLSVNTGYPTSLTIGMMLRKAFAEAMSLAAGACIFEKEFMEQIIAKSASEAKSLEKYLGG